MCFVELTLPIPLVTRGIRIYLYIYFSLTESDSSISLGVLFLFEVENIPNSSVFFHPFRIKIKTHKNVKFLYFNYSIFLAHGLFSVQTVSGNFVKMYMDPRQFAPRSFLQSMYVCRHFLDVTEILC